MAYPKQTWNDLPDRSTPLTAERLNHMEDGIYQNSTDIDSLSSKRLKYAYAYNTPNVYGIIELEDFNKDNRIIAAYIYERGNGYVIPYKSGDKWYLKCFSFDDKVLTSYVGIVYIYAETVDFGQ